MSNKHEDEITPRQLQKRVPCCRNTAYSWCERATKYSDGPLAGHVRRDATGHYWIKSAAIGALLSNQS